MVSTIIRGHRLDGYLNGTKQRPQEFISAGVATGNGTPSFGLRSNPEFERWIMNDQFLMGWSYDSMTEGIVTEVMGCNLATTLWRSLELFYVVHSKAKMDETRAKLQTTMKGSLSMAEYLRQMRAWGDILALASSMYLDSHLITNVLNGLDSYYFSILVKIEAKENITWKEL
ncbi:uncharacterized protein LOC133821924 [Humulus lupulus]|uniref:uncharacterized protein LOC133821924 n=1 Tax=Humulus lupulus TaxID=3486 RepID=UPI002B408FDA|nr:uncharacterized protein LOC133821924 [Humulus lupulus]